MSSNKNMKYKCPYCERRYTKNNLIPHVEQEHDDMIPQGYSPFQIVFNSINRKPLDYNGKCVICKAPTKFDENKGRYNRYCSNPVCKEAFIKNFEDNMMRTKGVTRISSTEEGLEKMLANRKISGEYKFRNGIVKSYTGSYELNALKFMDKIMEIDPDDIMCPGPVLEYEYQGKKHLYITDFLYIPYNLIIEVKDGGKNPNKREMPEYRAKQIAKERYIIKNTNYNYLRLTDNDLSQLLAVFSDLKMQLVDETNDRVIHVNESVDKSKVTDDFVSKQFKGNIKVIDIKSKPDIAMSYIEQDEDCKKPKFNKYIREKYKGEVIVDDKSDLPIGYCFIEDNGFIGTIFVFKQYRGYGFGETLVKDAINKYGGYDLVVYNDNEVAIKMYKRLGFVIIGYGNTKDQYWMKLNSHLTNDDKIMKESNNINEAMYGLLAGYMPGMKDGKCYYVNYLQNNVFSGEDINGYGITDNIKLTNLITRNKEGILEKAPDNFLENCRYSVYEMDITSEEVSKLLAPYIGTFVEEGFLYETLFNKKLYTHDQIMFENTVKPVEDFYTNINNISEYTRNLILKEDKITSIENELSKLKDL